MPTNVIYWSDLDPPRKPSKDPPNWNVSCFGEIRVAFSNYVRREIQHQSASEFPQFSRLPIELQYYIVYYCDIPTLFRLMQVSSALRTEAKKQFWSNPDTKFHVDDPFLIAGELTGHTSFDPHLLVHVQHLQVEFGDIRDITAAWECGKSMARPEFNDPPTTINVRERIFHFWQTLQSVFPHITSVNISENNIQSPGEPGPLELKTAILMCPTSIHASASILWQRLYDGKYYLLVRTMWQWEKTNTNGIGKWIGISTVRGRRSIIPPNKQLNGPVC